MIVVEDGVAYLDTDAPGVTCQVIEQDGIVMELNGNGTVISYVFPEGLAELDESPAERVDRLAGELEEARKALKAGQS